MNCEYCGTLIYADDRSCPKCGATIKSQFQKFVFNRDHVLRDSMLTWNPRLEQWQNRNGGRYDIRNFVGMNAETLEKMIELKFANPDEKQNESPTIKDFLVFLKDNPCYNAHGYVVTIERDDYRLSIEGVDGCASSAEELHNFSDWFSDADEFDIDTNYQCAWYD